MKHITISHVKLLETLVFPRNTIENMCIAYESQRKTAVTH
jgi:hypothetical protein